MPVYEYKCDYCGVMDIEQSIKDDALAECPKCKGAEFRKLISRTAFALKGGGWYAQGYGSGGSSKSSESSASSSTSSSSGD